MTKYKTTKYKSEKKHNPVLGRQIAKTANYNNSKYKCDKIQKD